MEETCKDCKHFIPRVSLSKSVVGGDCTKSRTGTGKKSVKENTAFTWSDRTCEDFREKQEPR